MNQINLHCIFLWIFFLNRFHFNCLEWRTLLSVSQFFSFESSTRSLTRAKALGFAVITKSVSIFFSYDGYAFCSQQTGHLFKIFTASFKINYFFWIWSKWYYTLVYFDGLFQVGRKHSVFVQFFVPGDTIDLKNGWIRC